MEHVRPTIYDVARHCGVAASTVSRAFSNPARVSAATRERVQAAAREIGYERGRWRGRKRRGGSGR